MSLVYSIIAVSIIVVLLLLFIISREHNTKIDSISFDYNFEETHIPIIKLTSNNIEVSFLVDTGAQASYIDSNLISKIEAKKIKGLEGSVMGINSEGMSTDYYSVQLYYKDNPLPKMELQSFDFKKAMANSRESTGIYLDGILGGDFLSKNGYIVDYTNRTIYKK